MWIEKKDTVWDLIVGCEGKKMTEFGNLRNILHVGHLLTTRHPWLHLRNYGSSTGQSGHKSIANFNLKNMSCIRSVLDFSGSHVGVSRGSEY